MAVFTLPFPPNSATNRPPGVSAFQTQAITLERRIGKHGIKRFIDMKIFGISPPKLQMRIFIARLLNHSLRKIHTDNDRLRRSNIMSQIPRSATEIKDGLPRLRI